MFVVLTKPISFTDLDKKNVVLEVDTTIYIDPNEQVAYINGYHFDISKDEYMALN